MNDRLRLLLSQTLDAVPDVVPLLSAKARFLLQRPTAYKSYDYFLSRIKGLVRGLYAGNVGGEFIDVFANLISGQYKDAYNKAWEDEGDGSAFPDYLEALYQEAVSKQYEFVDGYYRAIVDARIDETPIDPLLYRAELWAQGWNTSYENATTLITAKNGGKEEWVLGATEEHCPECFALNGIVMRAKEWDALGLRPKNPPNDKLTCEGWRCDCERRATDKRRTAGAYGKVEEILLAKA